MNKWKEDFYVASSKADYSVEFKLYRTQNVPVLFADNCRIRDNFNCFRINWLMNANVISITCQHGRIKTLMCSTPQYFVGPHFSYSMVRCGLGAGCAPSQNILDFWYQNGGFSCILGGIIVTILDV